MYKSMVVYLHESKNYVKKRESYLNFILYDVKQLINSNKFYTERKNTMCAYDNQLTRSYFIYLINKTSLIV